MKVAEFSHGGQVGDATFLFNLTAGQDRLSVNGSNLGSMSCIGLTIPVYTIANSKPMNGLITPVMLARMKHLTACARSLWQ
jgi:hypothetical protein